MRLCEPYKGTTKHHTLPDMELRKKHQVSERIGARGRRLVVKFLRTGQKHRGLLKD